MLEDLVIVCFLTTIFYTLCGYNVSPVLYLSYLAVKLLHCMLIWEKRIDEKRFSLNLSTEVSAQNIRDMKKSNMKQLI